MALTTIYRRGKIEDLETTLKRNRMAALKPGLITSFSNRVGALVLGVFVAVFGVMCGWALFTQKLPVYQTIIIALGVLAFPVGLWIVAKAVFALGKTARPHRFFYYDADRIVVGETRPLDQADIKRVLAMPKEGRVGALTALAPGFVEIPIPAVEYIGVIVAKSTLNIDKMTIKGADHEVAVDFTALMPSLNFSGVNGDMAFNAISRYFTAKTSNTVTASIENP